MDKPMPVVFVQSRELIFGAVNRVLTEYNLPVYQVDMIIDEVSRQVKQLSQEELSRAFKDFEASNKEEIKDIKEEDIVEA